MPKSAKKPKWKLVGDFSITEYQCGARAGDRVKLRKDLPIRDHTGKLTQTHPAGEIWTVLKGAAEPSVVLWLRQPDGQSHTWDDSAVFWEWFEKVDAAT